MIKPLVDETLVAINSIMLNAGISKKDISRVIAVGGSSRIPLVRENLINMFGKDKVNTDIDPATAIACGAAVMMQLKERERVEAEEKARQEAKEKVKKEAAEKARLEAEEKAKKVAKEKARKVAEEKARKVVSEKARKEAEEKAKEEVERKAYKAYKEEQEKTKREAEDYVREAKMFLNEGNDWWAQRAASLALDNEYLIPDDVYDMEKIISDYKNKVNAHGEEYYYSQ
jgi:flagellar biosynthesis GTPase FlhF